jgi:hypothetical protein
MVLEMELRSPKQAKNSQSMKWSREVLVSSFVLAFAIFACSFMALRVQAFDTNDLWLELALTNSVAQTNYVVRTNNNVVRTNRYVTLTYNAVAFTIHPPATNANGIYDLYFTTNLTDNQDWTWLLRNGPGQTNLTVTNLLLGPCFFRLGVTNAIRPGFNQQILDRNDDGSTGIVPIGFPINFFGSSNTTLYVNNNGNVTFDSPQSAYTPAPLNYLGIRIIAPYWADVDTRDTGSDVVKYGNGTVNGHAAFGVDWVNVGYYSWHSDRLLSCQLVIIDRSDIAAGNFDMELNYSKVQWEWGDASKYSPPHAGFSNGSNYDYELPGSGVQGAFLDSNVATGLIYHNLNSSVPGRYFFSFQNGQPLP